MFPTKEGVEDLFKSLIREIAGELFGCPPATQDLKLNTKNRDAAIKAKHIQYGPMNLADESWWKAAANHWSSKDRSVSPEVAKQSKCGNCVAFDTSVRMKECMPGETTDPDGELGYCWMHDFKCHSARSCYTWAAGGPIKDDRVSLSWQAKASWFTGTDTPKK